MLRDSRPVAFRARGLSDAKDATNAFPGAMALLQNLIPDPGTEGVFVPRPAATGLAGSGSANPTTWDNFTWGSGVWGGFDSVSGAAQINALLVVGNIIYGLIASTSGPNAGKDQPFAFNLASLTFLPIALPGGRAALPTTPASTGDWTPPTADVIGTRIIFTHPGFSGGAHPFFAWLDISGFTDAAKTGSTHSSTLIDGLSANVLQAGWNVGMEVAAAGVPANTTIAAIAADGLSLTLSQAATATAAAVALTVTGGTPTAPLWGAGNTNGNPLVAVPIAVANFNGRAYYAVPGAGTQFSDSGNPTQITNATQALTPRNGRDITAFGGLPVQQTQGGILQALIAFQGDTGMQQITGDAALNNLAINSLGVGVGCLAPNTITQTPVGLAFIAPDGLRYVDILARVSEPVGVGGTGVAVPFLNAINPSRMTAAYNQDVLRVTVQNGAKIGQPFEEYWYHVSRKVWSGPHSFTAALIAAFQGSANSFVIAATGLNASLWLSGVTPVVTSSYVENGQAMTVAWQTTLLPDNTDFAENRVNETHLALQLPVGSSLGVSVFDESGLVLGTVPLMGPQGTPSVWGSFKWGAAPWGGQQGFFAQRDLPWSDPLVFKQASFVINGVALAGLAIGNLYFRYKPLGYRLQTLADVAYVTPVPPLSGAVPAPAHAPVAATEADVPGATTDGAQIGVV